MKYKIRLEKEIDLDELEQVFNTNKELKNTMMRILNPYGYILIKSIVNAEIQNIKEEEEEELELEEPEGEEEEESEEEVGFGLLP